MTTICPRCGQGELVQATIAMTTERVVVCDECEALWPAGTVVAPDNFVDLMAYLGDKGIEGGWKALDVQEAG